MNKIELGDLVQDQVTKFKGIAVVRATYLTGCSRITIQPQLKKGKEELVECETFDEPGIKVIKARKVDIKQTKKEKENGGYKPDVSKITW